MSGHTQQQLPETGPAETAFQITPGLTEDGRGVPDQPDCHMQNQGGKDRHRIEFHQGVDNCHDPAPLWSIFIHFKSVRSLRSSGGKTRHGWAGRSGSVWSFLRIPP